MLALHEPEKLNHPDLPLGKIKCRCGHVILRDGILYSRVVNVAENKARCRCKRWIEVPIGWNQKVI
jgi:hypothetical protein